MARKTKDSQLINFNEFVESKAEKSKNEVNHSAKIKKRLNIAIADSYKRISFKLTDNHMDYESMRFYDKHQKIKTCNNRSLFVKCPVHKETHMVYTRYCKQRLCPLCSWIKSRRNKQNLLQLFDFMYTQEDYKYDKYYHLVLTVPNVKIEFGNVSRAIEMVDAMYQAFYDMLKNDELFIAYDKHERPDGCNLRKKKKCEYAAECKYFKKDVCTYSKKDKKCFKKPCFVGTIKVLEITAKYSHARQQWEVHPHFHVLLAVTPEFHFRKRRIKVPNNREWGYKWKNYMAKYIDIEQFQMDLINSSVKPKSNKQIQKILAEPFQCKVEMAYDKTVKKEDFLKRCKEYVESQDDELTDQEKALVAKGIDTKKLEAINKTLKAFGTTNKYDYETVKQAMDDYNKKHYCSKGALREIAKYTTKDIGDEGSLRINKDGSINFNDTDLVVYAFDKILNGRRLISTAGTFNKASKYLKLKLEEDIEETDEYDGGSENCHWKYEDGKFTCFESEATMSYIMHNFNLESQSYEQNLNEGDIQVLVDYVVDWYSKKEQKKTDVSDQTNISDDDNISK